MTTAGLDQITERFRGAGLGAAVELTAEAALGRLVRHADQAEKRRAGLWQAIHTVPIRGGALTGLSNQNGVIDQKDRLGPHTGYYWDVKRLSAWGWTAGSVSVYLNDPTGGLGGELLASYSTPGQWAWGKAHMSLNPDDRMVVVATGVTGAVYVAGSAIEVEAAWWPEYVL